LIIGIVLLLPWRQNGKCPLHPLAEVSVRSVVDGRVPVHLIEFIGAMMVIIVVVLVA
jgi:hypothetical protein